MRIVDPARFEPNHAVESVLTAAMPRYVMATLSAAMKDVDQFDAPGPAKIAAIQTNLGAVLFVVYHEEQDLLEILAPVDDHLIDNVAEVTSTLRVPATAIEWVHPNLSRAELLKRDLLPPRVVAIFEHHVVAQRLLLELLEGNGYFAHVVSSIHDLAKLFASTPPDVILVDPYALPRLDLAGIYRFVAQQSRNTQILVLGQTDELDPQPGRWRPADTLTTAGLLEALAGPYSKVN